MNAEAFFDTNVLVYATLEDDPRGPVARSLLANGGHVSVQVLNEFANVARKKLRRQWPDIRSALPSFGCCSRRRGL
jgi:predicted nucleic acid-binding protein